MKSKTFWVIIIVVAILSYLLISPLFFDKEVSEDLEFSPEEVLSEGRFEGLDSVHHGSGVVKIIRTSSGHILRFEDDFNVTNGPDLFVGFGKDGVYKKESQLEKLKGNIGSQNYLIPNDLDLSNYNEVWIWCRAFSVPFAKAKLG